MKKKLIALLCTAALLLTTAAIAAQAEPKPATDTRLADTSDALDILKCIVGLTDPLPLDPYDFNENGVIDNCDALEVLKSIVKIRDEIMIAFESEHTDPPTTTKLETIKIGNSVWQEVPVTKNTTPPALASRSPFDLRAVITGQTWYKHDYTYNTYTFSGTIVGMKEYEHSWTNDSDKWGPFARTVLEVKVTKEYNGKSPVDDDIIRVVYPFSTSYIFSDCFYILEGEEYVFASAWVLDEKYTDYAIKYAPESAGTGVEKHGNVIIGAPWCALFPVQDDKVIFYHEYLSHDEVAVEKFILPEGVDKKIFTTFNPVFGEPKMISGGFAVMQRADFDEAFLRLFENPEKLPTPDFNPFVD